MYLQINNVWGYHGMRMDNTKPLFTANVEELDRLDANPNYEVSSIIWGILKC